MFHKFAKLLIESKAMFYFSILKTQYCNFSFGILVNFLKDPSLKKKKSLMRKQSLICLKGICF